MVSHWRWRAGPNDVRRIRKPLTGTKNPVPGKLCRRFQESSEVEWSGEETEGEEAPLASSHGGPRPQNKVELTRGKGKVLPSSFRLLRNNRVGG